MVRECNHYSVSLLVVFVLLLSPIPLALFESIQLLVFACVLVFASLQTLSEPFFLLVSLVALVVLFG